ncbi:uncharacterized protein LOC100373148 [Saccoglossus kowalevskii]
MTQRAHCHTSTRGHKRRSIELRTQSLTHGFEAMALETPPVHKRRKTGRFNQLPIQDFPEPQVYTPGQLKLSIYRTRRHLMVNIIKARGISHIPGYTDGCYVTVVIVAPHGKKDSMATRVVTDATPHFQEIFPLSFLHLDLLDRIVISLYRQSSTLNDLMGCMSFGAKHLIKGTKLIDGWYYLLNQELGVKKHLGVPYKRPKLSKEVKKKQQPVRIIKKVMTVVQGKHGYGFTILDTTPVRVGKVDSGGPSEKVGLQMGDVIIRINKHHVERSPCTDIIGIVKNAPGHVRLVIERRAKTVIRRLSEDVERRPLNTLMSSNRCHNQKEYAKQLCGETEYTQHLCPDTDYARHLRYDTPDSLYRSSTCSSTISGTPSEDDMMTGQVQITVVCNYHMQQLELRLAAYSSPAQKTKQELMTLGDIYLAVLDGFISSYAVYQSCLRMAEENLAVKLQVPVWSDDEYFNTVRGFMYRPSEYLDKLCQLLQMLWTSTPTEHPDHENFKHVLNGEYHNYPLSRCTLILLTLGSVHI